MPAKRKDSGKDSSSATIGFKATFRRDLHPDLRADFVLANPPFNDSDWFRKDDDVRWQFGGPPKGNANLAWVQHFIHHHAPNGIAGFVFEKMERDAAIANFSLN